MVGVAGFEPTTSSSRTILTCGNDNVGCPNSLAHADWSNVPTWLGNTLTSGSLLLGSYMVMRDRRSIATSLMPPQFGCTRH